MSYDKFPFEDSTLFKKGKWYPMPIGACWTNGPKTYLDGYGVFKLIDDEDNGDIEPIVCGPLSLRDAVEISEAFNGEQFEEFKR